MGAFCFEVHRLDMYLLERRCLARWISLLQDLEEDVVYPKFLFDSSLLVDLCHDRV